MGETNNKLEIIMNLIYLARVSADQPEKVIEYLSLTETYVTQLAEALHSENQFPYPTEDR